MIDGMLKSGQLNPRKAKCAVSLAAPIRAGHEVQALFGDAPELKSGRFLGWVSGLLLPCPSAFKGEGDNRDEVGVLNIQCGLVYYKKAWGGGIRR